MMPNQLSLTHIHTSNPTPTLPYLSVHCSSRSIPAEPPTPPPPYLPTYLPTPHSLSFSSVPLLLSRDVLWQWSMYKPFVVLEHRPDGHHHHLQWPTLSILFVHCIHSLITINTNHAMPRLSLIIYYLVMPAGQPPLSASPHRHDTHADTI
jgi:hypothetical protein